VIETKLGQARLLTAMVDLEYLFRSSDGETCFVTVAVNGHHETYPIRSKAFRRWLVGKFYAIESKPPGAQALQDALGAIEARAQFGGNLHPVHVRVAGDDETIYLDLCDETWRVVEITADGWRITEKQEAVKFKRSRGMLPLPLPVRGGSINDLRNFVNLDNEEQWTLLAAWLVAALRPTGPYPVLALLGEQGTAKSTLQETFRALLDPNVAPLRAEPRDVRDVMIAASNGWCLVFDNLSDIEPWLSDCLCRLSTGGGFSTRTLFSDDDEIIFAATRPIMLNGIDSVISRADLFDRALIVELPRISDEKRRQRREYWSAFEAARPALLGALLDTVAVALSRHREIVLPSLPRMADFASWAVAAEPALGLPAGGFLAAYAGNQLSAHGLALDASPIAPAVRQLAEQHAHWKGTAAELLEELDKIADDATRRARTWPTTPRFLASALRRAAPSLRAIGVCVEFIDERELGARRRQIRVRRGAESSVPTVPHRSCTGSGTQTERKDGSVERGGNALGAVGNARNDGNNESRSRSNQSMLRPADDADEDAV
jgi:hypothetical protein